MSNTYSQQPKKIRTIIVDAGHGGSDAGAHGEYEGSLRSQEKNITLAISNKLVAELKKQLPGTANILPYKDYLIIPNLQKKKQNLQMITMGICLYASMLMRWH